MNMFSAMYAYVMLSFPKSLLFKIHNDYLCIYLKRNDKKEISKLKHAKSLGDHHALKLLHLSNEAKASFHHQQNMYFTCIT